MARGGYRPGAGRPVKKNPRDRRRRVAITKVPNREPSAAPITVSSPRSHGIDPSILQTAFAQAAEMVRTMVGKRPRQNPFQIPQFPKLAMPEESLRMAMDAGLEFGSQQYAAAGVDGLDYAGEGMAFLGYSYLSELAQRPEYRVISETVADDATREWIDFDVTGNSTEQDEQRRRMERDPVGEAERQSDPDDRKKRIIRSYKMDKIKQLRDDQERLEVRARFYDMARNDGFFGRSHLYLHIGDSDEISPQENAVSIGNGRDQASKGKVGKGSLRALRSIEPVWTYPLSYNAINPLAADWYNPQVWYVMGQQIHCSRLLPFIGHPVPDMLKPAYAFGGISLSQMAKPYVDIWLQTRESVAAIIKSFSVMVLSTDLGTMMQPGDANTLLARVALFNMLRDNQGTFVVNKDTEEFSNVSAPLSGLHELQAQAQEHMASVSRIPLVKLTGIQPAGLNASSEGEIKVYDDTIMAYQQRFFRPNLTRVINFQQLSLFGEIDPEITYDFEPLRVITQAEKGQKQKDDAERDVKYVEMGALAPGEVRRRIVDDPDLPYADLDPEDVPESPDDGMGGDPFGASEPEQGEAPEGGSADDLDPFFVEDEWSEADHPRASNGKFGSGGASRQPPKAATAAKSRDNVSGSIGIPITPKGLKRVGKQMGSNPGGVFEGKDGQRFYIKKPQSKAHVRNEMLAAALYGLAGSPTLKYRPVEGGEHVATEMTKLDKDRASKLSTAERKIAQQEFMVHAWLGNYDAVGTGGDNLGTVNGVPTALDLGGALEYRAQGAPKGERFGDKVSEIETMRDPKIAPDASRIYGAMSDDDLKAAAEKVTRISDADIRKVVEATGSSEHLADKLIARKRDIAFRFDVPTADQALDKATFNESDHPRGPDGKFTSGGGGVQSAVSKFLSTGTGKIADWWDFSKGGPMPSKKEIIGAMLTSAEGVTSEKVLSSMGWPSVSMPQQAAAAGLTLKKAKGKNGKTYYFGSAMSDNDAKSAKMEALKKKLAAKAAPKEVSKSPAPKPETVVEAVQAAANPADMPKPTAEQLAKAKKSTTLPLNLVPGGKPTQGKFKENADKIVAAFNDKYAGKDLTTEAELTQKIADFKALQAGVNALSVMEKDHLKVLAQQAQEKAAADAAKKAAEAAEQAKRQAAQNVKVMEGLGISSQQAEGVVALAKMLGSSSGDIVSKFQGYAEKASELGYPISGFQCALISNYSNGGYKAINNALRSGAWTPAQHVYVSMVNKALSAMPRFSGIVRRGATLSSSDLAKYKEGHIIQEQAFTSTSSGGGEFAGNVRFTIKAIGNRGASIMKLSNHKKESEVLFQARTFFSVNKITKIGDVTHIEMEEWEEH